MPVINGLDVIETLFQNIEEQSKRNIIIISGLTFFRSQLSNPTKIKWIFSKPIDYDSIIKEILEIKE